MNRRSKNSLCTIIMAMFDFLPQRKDRILIARHNKLSNFSGEFVFWAPHCSSAILELDQKFLYSNFDGVIPLKVAHWSLGLANSGMLTASFLVGLALPQIKSLITLMQLLDSVRKEI